MKHAIRSLELNFNERFPLNELHFHQEMFYIRNGNLKENLIFDPAIVIRTGSTSWWAAL